MSKQRAVWQSGLGFFLASAGSAVGLGNIWRFPYMAGENGGALFILVYLLIIIFITSFALICEIALGKYTKKNCVEASMQIHPRFKWLGFSMIVSTLLIPAFYFVVGGWIIYYLFYSFSLPAGNYGDVFVAMTAKPVLTCTLAIVFLATCSYFNYKGVNEGVEKCNKILMPMLCVIMVILAVFSLSLPGAAEGLAFMFRPDFSKLNGKVFIDALGQSFFTLSAGTGAMLIYGSYMTAEHRIIKNSYSIVAFDTLVAICAGLIIFPAVFTYGVEPQGGPGLVFVTLPEIFRQMPCGSLFSAAFFLLLLFASVTSGISLIENPVAVLHEMCGYSRQKAVVLTSIAIALLSLPCALSFGVLSDVKLFGKTFFDLFDFFSSNLLLPLNSMFICLGVAVFFRAKSDFHFKNRIYDRIFWIMTRYIIPVVMVIIIASAFIN